MEPFNRLINYYETDRMGIVHHSNYIRWFEEARVDWMNKIGAPYIEMERLGLFSPVLSVSCEYKFPFRFGDVAHIYVDLCSMTNVKFAFAYRIYNDDNKLCVTGTSSHCFVDAKGRPLALKRENPHFFEMFKQNLITDKE